jgi:histidine kinase/DNA gyrase B/HSP90-like ATPase
LPKPVPYALTIDLNTLNHLGIGLYSNIPAVVSEVVANSWDADASKVEITLDHKSKTITITDDGWGMTKSDINNKYLKVGYAKRILEPTVTPKERHVMGRKGIGKLSLFSIADTIEVHSIKKPKHGKAEKNGFVMDAKRIEETIVAGKGTYNPRPIAENKIEIKKGTRIVLRDLKKGLAAAEAFLRKRLARRFSIIGQEYGFQVIVNSKQITVADRDYFTKIEYLWYLGDESEKYAAFCVNSKRKLKVDATVNAAKDYRVTGWVGTFDEQKSIEEGNNTIVILAWGKLVHEDILKDLKEGGVYTKYLIGEIRADFLDLDEQDDIATTDRQRLKENDPRFEELRKYVQEKLLKVIQSKWRDWRNEDAEKKALENSVIKEWFEQLGPDNRKYARKLFGDIESFPIEDPNYKKELYKHGILAFETLALQDNLDALDKVDSDADFDLLMAIFASMDELEAVHYWQITKNRVAVLKTFEDIAPTAKEKVIQKHIFEHLWLLDPSWERASTDEKMEESVTKEWKKIDAKLTADEKKGRFDIRYRTAAGKHIIIELKKYNRKVKATALVDQVVKYKKALEKCLKKAYPDKPQIIEVICLLGTSPEPQDDDKMVRDLLAAADARYITYDELIRQTRDSYRDYLDRQKKISRIQALIEKL